MIGLRLGEFAASVDVFGGRLRGFSRAGCEFLAGGQPGDGVVGYRGALLAPWPNRLADGRWEWEARELHVPINDPGSHSALHGLIAQVVFEVVEQTPSAVLLEHELAPSAGYPFRLLLRVSYALDDRGVNCRLAAVNAGDRPAPVGLGVHPYLCAPGLVDDLMLTLPAATVPVVDHQWIEQGRVSVEVAGLDFRAGRRIGPLVLDTAFTDLQRDRLGKVHVQIGRPDGVALTLWAGDTCRWLTVYTADTQPAPDRRRSLAMEPQTCSANALRSGDDLDVVAPGQEVHLEWGFTAPA